MVEWCSGGVVEWWSGGVAEWWSGGVVEWWSGGVVEWWSGGVVEWWSGGVVVWWSGGVVEWWSGGVVSGGVVVPCAVPCGAVLPRCAAVSCPAALLGLFLAWVWLYLLEKPLQNFVKYFFSLFLAFEKKIKLYTTQHTRVQPDHVRCCALRATRRS